MFLLNKVAKKKLMSAMNENTNKVIGYYEIRIGKIKAVGPYAIEPLPLIKGEFSKAWRMSTVIAFT